MTDYVGLTPKGCQMGLVKAPRKGLMIHVLGEVHGKSLASVLEKCEME